MLDRAAIAARIPHGDSMCLLDRVVSWDERSVHCTTGSHRSKSNPLREPADGAQVAVQPNEGMLPVWAGVEYAAQAAAVHGALVNARAEPRQGVLAAARDVRAACERLDQFAEDLSVSATVRHSDPAGAIYVFEVRAGERVLLSGQFTLMFSSGPVGAAP